MTRKQVLSLIDWHHAVVPKAQGGKDTHWNIEPVLRAQHKEITRKETVPSIAKSKRIVLDEQKHREFMRKIKPRRRKGPKQPRWRRKW